MVKHHDILYLSILLVKNLVDKMERGCLKRQPLFFGLDFIKSSVFRILKV